jgi:hypothetical protein
LAVCTEFNGAVVAAFVFAVAGSLVAVAIALPASKASCCVVVSAETGWEAVATLRTDWSEVLALLDISLLVTADACGICDPSIKETLVSFCVVDADLSLEADTGCCCVVAASECEGIDAETFPVVVCDSLFIAVPNIET